MHRVRLSGWWRVPGTEEGSKHVRVSRWDRTECYEILLSPTCLDKTIVSFRDHIEVTCGVPVYYQRIFVETVEITRLASNKTLKEVADLADRAQSETVSIRITAPDSQLPTPSSQSRLSPMVFLLLTS